MTKQKTSEPFRSPSEQLAEQATQAFATADYIRPEDLYRLQAGLTDGSLRAEDWISFAENALYAQRVPAEENC